MKVPAGCTLLACLSVALLACRASNSIDELEPKDVGDRAHAEAERRADGVDAATAVDRGESHSGAVSASARNQLEQVEALIASGDRAEARRLLSDAFGHGVWPDMAGIEDSELIEVAIEIDRVARTLELERVQLEARERIHDARERILEPEHPDLLRAKLSLAQTLQRLDHVERAYELLVRVHEVRDRALPEGHPDLVAAKNGLAMSCMSLGDYRMAAELFRYVVAVREKELASEDPRLIGARQNLAAALHAGGDHAAALASFEAIHAQHERSLAPDHPNLIDAKRNLAKSRKALGDLQGAVELELQVVSTLERLLSVDDRHLLAAQGDLAETMFALGEVEGALAIQERVVQQLSRVLPEDHEDLLRANLALAATRHGLGDYSGALVLLEAVHEKFQSRLPPDHPTLQVSREFLGGTRSALGDQKGALELFEAVLASRERTLPPEHLEVLAARQNVAVSRRAFGDAPGALDQLERVHLAWSELLPEHHPHMLRLAQNIASTKLVCGDVDGAWHDMSALLPTMEDVLGPAHADYLAALQDSAIVLARKKEHAALRATAEKLLESQSQLLRETTTQSSRQARSSARRELDRLSWLSYWSELLDMNGHNGLDDTLLEILEGARLVATDIHTIDRAMANHANLRPSIVELKKIRSELGRRMQIGPSAPESLDAWRESLIAFTEERDRLQRMISLELEALGVEIELPTIHQLAASLSDREALVAFWSRPRREAVDPRGERFRSTNAIAAFIVTSDARVQRVELGSADAIASAIGHWRNAIGAATHGRSPGLGLRRPEESDWIAAGAAVRELVLDPICAKVPEATELRCVLDDALFLVPLDALPLGDGIVGERYMIRVGTTVRQFDAAGERASGDTSLLVVGGVDYAASGADVEEGDAFVATPPMDNATRTVTGAAFTPLEGAALEAQRVGALFEDWSGRSPALLTSGAATKAALVDHVENARYLHIATHGWFAPESAAVSMLDALGDSASNELRLSVDRVQDTIVGFLPDTLCGLALAGANNGPEGILTAEELGTLDLTNCELAVLSACETNVGIRRAGQGIQSLQTALHAAGARTAITSLWKVDDAATCRLFELFYTKLWSENLGPADALWQAKMALRSEGHPTRDWAGWVLTGSAE